jgi:hypothetical protein
MIMCGILLAISGHMSGIQILCDHCEGPLIGRAYRVISEEDGVRLLDMVVCHGCYLEARRIGLKTLELGSVPQHLPGRN